MGERKQKPQLHIPMSEAALEKLKLAAQRNKFESTAAFVRALIGDAVPELSDELSSLGWGGSRGRDKTDT